MIKGISEFEKYKLIRPLFGEHEFDEVTNFPIVKAERYDDNFFENIIPINVKNLTPEKISKEKLVLMYNYDNRINSLWNDPLKKVPLFQACGAVATPDYSFYPKMNENDIRHNVYRGRWLGCTWQDYGCKVIPTIGWALPNTYDICFSGVEHHSVVTISTIGCREHRDVFLEGFHEMKKRIDPPIIIVYGDMIDGMTGRFINIPYSESFDKKYIQLRFPQLSRIFTITEVA